MTRAFPETMPITPVWRTRIFTAIAVVVAIWMGWAVAGGDSLPLLCCGVLVVFGLTRWLSVPLGTFLVGVVLFGYIVGNRGFAQLSLTKLLPLLPAEAVLAAGCALLLVRCAWRHELPFRRDPLNLAILLWIVVGVIRVAFDVRNHGFLAVRDFATVYYAVFFFLAQDAARDRAGRNFLSRVLLFSCALLLPLSTLYIRFPDFFLDHLTVRHVPLIYYKGDLLGTFLAVGAVLFFLRYEGGGSRWNVLLSLLFGVGVLASNNRASMLGLIVATAWLQTAGRWRFAATQLAAGVMAATIILLAAAAMNLPWQRTPVYGLYERTLSLVDISGERTYTSDDSANKGDNNVFRKVWWQAVFDETVEYNPYVGLGFGHNLADRFVRTYYPDSTEEFSTRSPHNILLTVFARMGGLGLAIFLVMLAIVGRRTWRAVRRGPREGALWCSVWVIFTTACLGVVLEGPMGAVVFWVILGMASAEFLSDDQPEGVGEAAEVLLPEVPPDEVPATL